MKQTTLLDNKYISSSKGEKHKPTDSRSIDVDRVKVYHIDDAKHNIRSIDLESVKQAKQNIRFGRIENREFSHKRGTQSSQKMRVEEKREREREKILERQDKENNSGNYHKRNKKSPLQSIISKLHKIIGHFLSIDETNPAYGVTSQQFYNLFQSRKALSLHPPNQTSVPKFLFEASYTNYLSFLSSLIETKQNKYEVYDSLQQLEKILQFIQTQICDLQEIYLAEEQAKSDLIYSEDLMLQIQKVQDQLAFCYPKNKKVSQVEVEQDLTVENYQSISPPNNIGQAQEGQINLQSFSNHSFSKGSKEILDAQIGPLNSKQLIQRDEYHVLIEEESRQQTQVFYGQSSEKLISYKEERQIYEANQALVESGPDQQQSPNSQNMMELEE